MNLISRFLIFAFVLFALLFFIYVIFFSIFLMRFFPSFVSFVLSAVDFHVFIYQFVYPLLFFLSCLYLNQEHTKQVEVSAVFRQSTEIVNRLFLLPDDHSSGESLSEGKISQDESMTLTKALLFRTMTTVGETYERLPSIFPLLYFSLRCLTCCFSQSILLA